MSRTSAILERIEAIAYKMKMSIEDAVSILEGKHPTHAVVTRETAALANPPKVIDAGAVQPASSTNSASVGTAQSNMNTAASASSAANPTVAASAGSSQESSAAAEEEPNPANED